MSLLHRQLRHELTEPEQLLWDKLRNRKLGGFEFRHQHPIGPYVADFVCLAPKLVVELDGRRHLELRDYDETRTSFRESQGFMVIRFRNIEIYLQQSVALSAIEATLLAQLKSY